MGLWSVGLSNFVSRRPLFSKGLRIVCIVCIVFSAYSWKLVAGQKLHGPIVKYFSRVSMWGFRACIKSKVLDHLLFFFHGCLFDRRNLRMQQKWSWVGFTQVSPNKCVCVCVLRVLIVTYMSHVTHHSSFVSATLPKDTLARPSRTFNRQCVPNGVEMRKVRLFFIK
jgi:hypothetical protein